jgi:hypothetical protein
MQNFKSLEDKIQALGNPVDFLRNATVVWGNHDNSNPIVETHTQSEIRATVGANAYL